ncbi:hypothetical protein EJ06DRAFT_508068 [Trichodelitschia bisporula]|uniref:Mitochondrial intermembrane space import and assembly protein 40 n=1 Tax=Trichodelitschia bisporula TaxID=703511 RepID=A0A6G1I0Y5_9PEZI|nr:hypothetical protein EJ06DRAFT_508068 [Trichodelitschia bisporula]
MIPLLSRPVLRAGTATSSPWTHSARRLLSTAPTKSRGTWKGTALRWGLAGAAVYYYNTSDLFAEQPRHVSIPAPSRVEPLPEPSLPTVEDLVSQRRAQHINEAAAAASEGGVEPGSPEALQQEADSQGAFNPETGEINWDCPCLGGMASGPCGEEFKAAFSCFVYSKEEPKGVECIDKFKGMQDCFRKYPEVYGAELEEDDDYEGSPPADADQTEKKQASSEPKSSSASEASEAKPSEARERAEKVVDSKPSTDPAKYKKQERAKVATEQVNAEHELESESDAVVPNAWHDAK